MASTAGRAQTCKRSGRIRETKPPEDSARLTMALIAAKKASSTLLNKSSFDHQRLSEGWRRRKRCHKFIDIHGNGRTTRAMVVNECDSTMGCEADLADQPPRTNNMVDASKTVGRLWVFQRILLTGDGWISLGLMHDVPKKKLTK
ncbi:hypothetical protein RJ639_033810 [Escallonia herrerae]|uniref:Uncharacterized protein n=1 Tax=Escallonia herrerae TaxID=1293975 RepID=A0AA88WX49_9ASTE|nr:hypothetical protein RJ639_033810 [Escallonia herrerae]